jgi:TetR/AcrR family fatty acid metabolism transcriptional regulator
MNIQNLRSQPPGRKKILLALYDLLKVKDFNAITTTEISKKAGITEGLIYKYFKNKRDLLYQCLQECFEQFIARTMQKMDATKGVLSKLQVLIRAYLEDYNEDRVLARMVLLEVRTDTDFFKSDAYKLIQIHSRTVLNIIEEGVLNGEIRNDIKPSTIRNTFFGAIEHACLANIIFNREIPVDKGTEDIYKIIIRGIAAKIS